MDEPELITTKQAALLGNLSASMIKKLCRRRKRGEPKAPFRVIKIGRAIRINRNEFLSAINQGIPSV